MNWKNSKAALDAGKTVDATAEEIERLLTKGAKSVQHTLRALLVELSNESETGVDSPGVAGGFLQSGSGHRPDDQTAMDKDSHRTSLASHQRASQRAHGGDSEGVDKILGRSQKQGSQNRSVSGEA